MQSSRSRFMSPLKYPIRAPLSIKLSWKREVENLKEKASKLNVTKKYLAYISLAIHKPIACEQQTHFRSSLLSLRKIAIFRRERSDDRKCVCGSQANKPINRRCFTCESAHCYKVYCRILRNACCRHNHAFTPILDGAGGAGGAGRPEFPPSFPKKWRLTKRRVPNSRHLLLINYYLFIYIFLFIY